METPAFRERHKHPIRIFLIAVLVMITSGMYLLYQLPDEPNKDIAQNQTPEVKDTSETGTTKYEIKNTPRNSSGDTGADPVKNIDVKKNDSLPEPKGEISEGIPVDSVQATVVINGQSTPVNLIPESTVYDALKKLAADGKISVEFKSYSGLGYFVESLNGITSDKLKGTYWIFSINGAKAQVGISSYSMKSGDVITWKYESAE